MQRQNQFDLFQSVKLVCRHCCGISREYQMEQWVWEWKDKNETKHKTDEKKLNGSDWESLCVCEREMVKENWRMPWCTHTSLRGRWLINVSAGVKCQNAEPQTQDNIGKQEERVGKTSTGGGELQNIIKNSKQWIYHSILPSPMTTTPGQWPNKWDKWVSPKGWLGSSLKISSVIRSWAWKNQKASDWDASITPHGWGVPGVSYQKEALRQIYGMLEKFSLGWLGNNSVSSQMNRRRLVCCLHAPDMKKQQKIDVSGFRRDA